MAFELRPEWLDLVQEEIVEPERRIVDPHHHFFTETTAFPHYRLEDLWADTGTPGRHPPWASPTSTQRRWTS